jgi:hypothetical protein
MILPNGKVFNPPANPPGTGVLAPSGASGGVVVNRDDFKPYNSSVDEIKKAINKIIGSSSSNIIRYRYPQGTKSNIKDIKSSITSNPKFIDDIIDIVGTDLPRGTKADDILKIVAGDEAKRKAILDALKGLQLPDSPIWIDDKGNKTITGQPDSDPNPSDPNVTTSINGIKDKINQTTKDGGGTTTDPLEVTKTLGDNTKTETKTDTKTDTDTKTKTDTDTKTKEEEDDDEEPKPPVPDDKEPPKKEGEITERPISSVKQKMNVQRQWMPEYSMGGQNILKLTDVEKLEELKHYTLFDLVNPLLVGDENNLLALQNKIQENRRFTNTYANPTPERPLQPPKNIESWRQPMRSVYPTPYPFTIDMPQANNYYDRFNNQDYHYLNKNLDSIARGGTFDPDLQQVLNNKRDSYTATCEHVMNHTANAKNSLLEDLDSGSITQLDLLMLR